jgi:hypothetical protein
MGNSSGQDAIRKACVGDDEGNADYAARMLAAVDDIDGAYEILKGHSFDWRGSTTFLFYPEMASFRSDPRFMPLIAKSGLLEFWTKSGHWPDYCSDSTLPYDCKTEAARAMQAAAQ